MVRAHIICAARPDIFCNPIHPTNIKPMRGIYNLSLPLFLDVSRAFQWVRFLVYKPDSHSLDMQLLAYTTRNIITEALVAKAYDSIQNQLRRRWKISRIILRKIEVKRIDACFLAMKRNIMSSAPEEPKSPRQP